MVMNGAMPREVWEEKISRGWAATVIVQISASRGVVCVEIIQRSRGGKWLSSDGVTAKAKWSECPTPERLDDRNVMAMVVV
jgi:hypothetical protein